MQRLAGLAMLAALAVGGYSLTSGNSASVPPLIAAQASGYMKGYVTLQWASIAGADGYVLTRDGVTVSTAGAGATSTRFLVTAGQHALAAIPFVKAQTTTTTVSTSTAATTTAATTTAPATTTTPAPSGVAPPQPPSAYTVPASATVVSTSAQLSAALAAGTKEIALADGVYDNASAFVDSSGSHVYAQHLGKATLTAGFVVGGNGSVSGGQLQGLTFNVSSPAKTNSSADVYLWGTAATGARILDCAFEGNWTLAFGILDYAPAGADVERLVFKHFTDVALRLSDNKAVAYGSATPKIAAVSDIDVDGVSRATPGASNGTAEAGVWIGHPVTGGVSRIRVRNVSWSGLETVNDSWDTTFHDLDIDMRGPHAYAAVGVYMEHFTRHDVFQRFTVWAKDGFNSEWDDGTAGNAGGHFNTIQDGTIDGSGWTSRTVGVYLDAGTESTTVRRVTFNGQTWAGIGAYLTTGINDFSSNTFNLAAGAVQVSTSHF